MRFLEEREETAVRAVAGGDTASHLDAMAQQGCAQGRGRVCGRVIDGDLFVDRGLTGFQVAIDLEVE